MSCPQENPLCTFSFPDTYCYHYPADFAIFSALMIPLELFKFLDAQDKPRCCDEKVAVEKIDALPVLCLKIILGPQTTS